MTDRLAGRISSAAYFDAYFRYTLGELAIGAQNIAGLLERSRDKDFVLARMKVSFAKPLSTGGSEGHVILSSITELVDTLEDDDFAKVQGLLATLFCIADELERIYQSALLRGAPELDSIELRIIWLANVVLGKTIAQSSRESFLDEVLSTTSLSFGMHLTEILMRGARLMKTSGTSETPIIVDEIIAKKWIDHFDELARLEVASGDIFQSPRPFRLLHTWRRIQDAIGAPLDQQLLAYYCLHSACSAQLLKSATQGWFSNRAGQILTMPSVNPKIFAGLFDPNEVHNEAERLAGDMQATENERQTARSFLEAWDNAHNESLQSL